MNQVMHNFERSDISIEDSLNDVGFKLRSDQNVFFIANKERLKALFKEYNEKAANNTLHTLVREWVPDPTDDVAINNEKKNNQTYAYGLYGSKRPFVIKRWAKLIEKNGGDIPYCPICGLHLCEEMDHYVPRDIEKFPEYAAHLDNLIPLCHSCNHTKSNKFLGDNGERLYFNAYFDKLTDRNILVCDITLSPVDELPQIKVRINPELSETKVPDKYILSTIKDLKLMYRFNVRAKLLLRDEMDRLSASALRGQSWEVTQAVISDLAVPKDGNPDIVYPAVLRAIANSTDIASWYNSL